MKHKNLSRLKSKNKNRSLLTFLVGYGLYMEPFKLGVLERMENCEIKSKAKKKHKKKTQEKMCK